jgi:phosphate transport system protein
MSGKETQLQQGLSQLRTRLLVMCATVDIAVTEACAALFAADPGRADAVIEGDTAIDQLENEIDEMAFSLLVRYQPVAQDLRLVVAAQRIVTDLERIGDEAVNIADRVLSLSEPLPGPVAERVQALANAAGALYRKAVEAFRTGDTRAALELRRSDEESALMEVQALRGIMDFFSSDETKIGQSYTGMHGILICRSLNRICRRAANIAEHTYFSIAGVNLKHVPSPGEKPESSSTPG